VPYEAARLVPTNHLIDPVINLCIPASAHCSLARRLEKGKKNLCLCRRAAAGVREYMNSGGGGPRLSPSKHLSWSPSALSRKSREGFRP
jgi:hypothetical protein